MTDETHEKEPFELVLTQGRAKPLAYKCYSGEALAQWYEHQLQKELNVDPIDAVDNKPKKRNKKAPKKHSLEATKPTKKK